MENYIDLHIHSKYSDDGEFTPKELVAKCKDAGVKIMAIADHNSVKAIETQIAYCKEFGLICIPAIEIDCVFNGINLHVLGYGINYKSEAIINLEDAVFQQELVASTTKLALTNSLGFDLVADDLHSVSSNGVWTGEMFGEVLLNKEEYKNHELLKPYRKGGDRGDNPYVNFYWDFYAQGKPCYTEIVFPTLQEVIDMINENGGVSVLAHPGNNLKDKYALFDDMAMLGLDGVEVFSSYHDEDTIAYFYEKGKEYAMLITCGSDYHGKTKPAITLKDSRCTINQKQIEQQLVAYGLI